MIWWSIHYDWLSAALFLIIVMPLLWGFFFLYRYRQDKLAAFANPTILDRIVEKRLPVAFWTKSSLFCLIWVCAVIALMQPKGNERYVTSSSGQTATTQQVSSQKVILRKKMHEVIFLLDASTSMSISDAHGGKTRESVAKEIVDNVISDLHGESVSLFAFTAATIQIVPSTMDYLFTRLMLRQVEINEGETAGTQIKQALEAVRNRYFSSTTTTTKTVILLTDGGDTSLEGVSSEKRKGIIDDIVQPIADAENKNVRVLVVGIGSKEGKEVPGATFQGHPVLSSLEEPLLRRLSRVGRGELIIANEMTPFQASQLLSKGIAHDEAFVDASIEIPLSDFGENIRVYDFYFQIPLGLAILGLMGCLLIPDTRKRVVIDKNLLVVLLLFLNTSLFGDIRLADRYFDAGDYTHAYTEYQGGLDDHLSDWQQAILLYNMGSALLAQEKWEEALSYFDRSADQSNELPLLNQHLTANRALASLMLFKTHEEALNLNQRASNEDYNQMILSFLTLQKDIETASSAWCTLFSIEGAQQCPAFTDLNEMRKEAKQVYAKFLTNSKRYRMNYISKLVFGGTPVDQAIERLLKVYVLVLASEPIQEKELQLLIDAQNEAESVLNVSLLKESYQLSRQYLKRGLDELRAHHPTRSRVFILTAQFFLENMVTQVRAISERHAETILEVAIQKETFVLALDQSNLDAEDVQQILPAIQQVVLTNADEFLSTLLVEEETAFSANNASSCQSHPWDDVVPLFSEGYSAARRAQELLKQQQPVTQWLQIAVKAWKEALEKMRAPPSMSPQTPEKKKSEVIPQAQESGTSANDVLRLIQEMELDDKSQVDLKIQGSRGDDRPW